MVTAFALWMLLFWSLDLWVIVAGAAVAVLVGAMLGQVFPDNAAKALDPRRWFFFIVYVPYFLYWCLRANIDVALRVVNPNLPIKPGIIKVSTTLTGEMAKTFLANSITLTPGTLTVDIDDQDLYIHWINIDTDDVKQRTAQICERFEPLLRRIFE
jgi:multicomponent Na+:H+ antiporter subunit E